MPKLKNHGDDTFAVAYTKDGERHWAQTEATLGAAQRACKQLNDHELRCGRSGDLYSVDLIDAPQKGDKKC